MTTWTSSSATAAAAPTVPHFRSVRPVNYVGTRGHEGTTCQYNKHVPTTNSGRPEIFGQEFFWHFKATPEVKQADKYRSRSLMDIHKETVYDKFVVCYSTPINPQTRESLIKRKSFAKSINETSQPPLPPRHLNTGMSRSVGDGQVHPLPPKKKRTTAKLFTIFDTYIEFFTYCQYFVEEELGFFEIIPGLRTQKPYFDIDIELSKFTEACQKIWDPDPFNNFVLSAEWIKDMVITATGQLLASKNVYLDVAKDVLIYTSHDDKKRSFHIVINNYYHGNNNDARAFALAVMAIFETMCPYKQFIDTAVYSRFQQFRMVKSRKWGSNRPKTFQESFYFMGNLYNHTWSSNDDFSKKQMKEFVTLRESLISFTSGCNRLPSWYVVPVRFKPNVMLPGLSPNASYKVEQDVDVTETMVDRCMTLMEEKIADAPFTFNEINDYNQICLRRDNDSLCPVCERTHTSNNPYMFIKGNRVWWNCRANAERKSFFLGLLDPSKDDRNNSLAAYVNAKPEAPPELERPNRGFNFAPPALAAETPIVEEVEPVEVLHPIALTAGFPDFVGTAAATPDFLKPPPEPEPQDVVLELDRYLATQARESFRLANTGMDFRRY